VIYADQELEGSVISFPYSRYVYIILELFETAQAVSPGWKARWESRGEYL